MCFMKTPKIEAPKAPSQPDEPELAARRQAELARALPGRDTLRITGPLGVPNYQGGATALLLG